MKESKCIVYEGITYKSVQSLAEAKGVPVSALYQRLSSGMSIEDAMSKPFSGKRSNSVIYNGVEYPSISALSRATGVAYTLLRDRITKSGMTAEEAINTPVREFGVDYDGVHYDSVQALASAVNMKYSVLKDRLSHGMSVEDAVTMPRYSKPQFRVSYGGVTYKSREDLCNKLGISYNVLSNRIKGGQTLEQAVDALLHPVNKPDVVSTSQSNGRRVGKQFEYDGVVYDSLLSLAESVDLEVHLLKYRLNKGMSVEDAIADARNIGVDYQGKHYATITSLAADVGVSAKNLQAKIRNGISVDDAVEDCKRYQDDLQRRPVNNRFGILYNGVEYESVKALAEYLGLKASSIIYRLKSGMSVEDAVENIRKSQVVYNNVTYSSLQELARAYDVEPRVFADNVRSGLSVEDALEVTRNFKPRDTRIEYVGVHYPSLRALCIERNMDYSLVVSRLSRGWSLEKSIETPKVQKDTSLVYNGETYPGVASLARAVGINRETLWGRLSNGMSVEEAVETPIMEKGEGVSKSVEYKGKMYKSQKALCEAYGVDAQLVATRLSEGWTLERAIETPKGDVHKVQKLVIAGVEYPSKQAAYDAYNIPKHAVRTRVNNGMSLEEAITTPWSKFESKPIYVYDSKEFNSFDAIDKYIGVAEGTVYRYIRKGHTFEESCKYAEELAGRDSVSLKDYPGSRQSNLIELRKHSATDEQIRKWLTLAYKDVPTEFHEVVYKSVSDACDSLGLPVDVVRARMFNLMTFQEAVHDRYFVVDDCVYLTREALRKALNVSRPVFERVIKGLTSNDDIVSAVKSCAGSSSVESTSLSIRKSNEFIDAVINCRNGYYVVYCVVCGRPLYLTEEEARSFEHSNEFCESHVQATLYREGVSARQFRTQMGSKGSYESVIKVYENSENSAISFRISCRDDVSGVKLMLGGKYAIIECSCCGRTVFLPIEDAKLFKHSNLCEKYEWKEG